MWVRRHFRWFLAAVTVATSVCAADDMPSGYFRGAMVSFEGTAAEGILTARAGDGALFDCSYDSKSYLEFAKQRVTPAKLLEGDRLEVLVDRSGRGRACYIRILHVLPPESSRPARPKAQRPPSRILSPVATMTISGIVVHAGNGSITVRGRDRQETMLVRRDTRFVANGARTDVDALAVSQRVFVEAGHNLDGDLEAYQVTWGGIVTVR